MATTRRMCLRHLGDQCVRCGFCDIRALQFDHIYGDGYKLRVWKRNRREPSGWVRNKAIIASYDNGTIRDLYQILCANCNQIKRRENGEHRSRTHSPTFFEEAYSPQMELFREIPAPPGTPHRGFVEEEKAEEPTPRTPFRAGRERNPRGAGYGQGLQARLGAGRQTRRRTPGVLGPTQPLLTRSRPETPTGLTIGQPPHFPGVLYFLRKKSAAIPAD